MRKFGLIGFPLGHSFSKKYFTEKFLSEGIKDTLYENYPLEDLSQLPSLIAREPNLCGLNVTIPYKTEVLKYVDKQSADVQEIGAVNVLKINRSGNAYTISGFNSDITGIYETLAPYLTKPGCNVLVLGTGGASKALNYTLRKFGCNVNFVSREAREGVYTYDQVNSGMIFSNKIIINSTPLGMFPNIITKPPIDYTQITSDHILFDLVYNPEITAFLEEGMKRGATTLTGLKMLFSQAERAWEIWNNETL